MLILSDAKKLKICRNASGKTTCYSNVDVCDISVEGKLTFNEKATNKLIKLLDKR